MKVSYLMAHLHCIYEGAVQVSLINVIPVVLGGMCINVVANMTNIPFCALMPSKSILNGM